MMLCWAPGSWAVTPTTPKYDQEHSVDENTVGKVALTKKEIRKQRRIAKRQQRLSKFMNKLKAKMPEIDLNDPVKKWMWFWIFGWGAWFLLSIIAWAAVSGGIYSGTFGFGAVLFTLGWLAGLAGTVALIIWLVKLSE